MTAKVYAVKRTGIVAVSDADLPQSTERYYNSDLLRERGKEQADVG